MKLLELLQRKIVIPAMTKRDPNWEAMQAKRRSGAMGKHRDKKREDKLGMSKHKKSCCE